MPPPMIMPGTGSQASAGADNAASAVAKPAMTIGLEVMVSLPLENTTILACFSPGGSRVRTRAQHSGLLGELGETGGRLGEDNRHLVQQRSGRGIAGELHLGAHHLHRPTRDLVA